LCCASVGAPHSKSPPDGNNSRIPYSEGSLPHKQNFLKFKHENVIKMKNKPAPALLRPSKLSNEIIKRVPKSRETIPLRDCHIQMQFNLLATEKSIQNKKNICWKSEQ
jgi:hypothetical protein